MQSQYKMWIGLMVLILVVAFVIAFGPIRPVPKDTGFNVQNVTRFSFPERVAPQNELADEAATLREKLAQAGIDLDNVEFKDTRLLEVSTVALTQEQADEYAAKITEVVKEEYPGASRVSMPGPGEEDQPLFTVGNLFAVYPPEPQVRLGLDLQGGAHVLLRCMPETRIDFKSPENQPMAIPSDVMQIPESERPQTTPEGNKIQYPTYTHAQLQELIENYLISNGVPEEKLTVEVISDSRVQIRTEASNEQESSTQRDLAQAFLERTFPNVDITTEPIEAVYIEDNTADKVKNIIERRLYRMSEIREPVVQKQGDQNIIVELPGVKDPDRVLDILKSTALLEFRLIPSRYEPAQPDTYAEWRDVRSNEMVPWEQVLAESELAFSGRDLQSNAQVQTDNTGAWVVRFEMQSKKKREFLAFTQRNVGRLMAIVLDKECQMAPKINGPIPGEGIIEGNFSTQEARDLKLLLNAGALPVPLKIDTNRTISPTLGTDSIIRSFRAAVIGFILVLIFMMAFYRIPGVLASIALVMYVLLTLALLTWANATMTLPGVAAFILSIGMAVDANVIIFERLKEEIWSGKGMRMAIDAGFERAWTAILDANVTTLIVAAVLYFLGTSAIKSFAVTLFIGVACSLFTAVTVTRWLVTIVGTTKLGENAAAFGAGGGTDTE
ncbi:MAG: protein translocase subunit SecD [Armatimonadota bacterium]